MIDKKINKKKEKKIKILIVEDEVLVAQDIIQRLTTMDYEVIGFAMTANSAIELIEENPTIDLLLIDIMIQGNKDGIELAGIIRRKYEIPFIFLTSNTHKQTVKRAHLTQPHAYILKPFNDRQMSIAIDLALLNFSKKNTNLDFNSSQNLKQYNNKVLHIKNCLFLKRNTSFKKVPLDEILFIEADNNYSTIHTKNEKFIYAIVMKKIEEQLPKNIFLRTHRSYIVNKNAIEGFEGNMLYLKSNKIPISKSHKEHIFSLFKTI